MSREVVACMGGWCRQRDACAHYHSRSQVRAERLCQRGEELPDVAKPLNDEQRFGAWLAGATAEQVEAWKRRNDTDAGLPAPLRNGALEVF